MDGQEQAEVSVTFNRLRLRVFLPASYPLVAREGVSTDHTDCESYSPAVGRLPAIGREI